MTSRLSQNTIALLISNGGSAVSSFVLSVLIGRVLGEDGLGIYTTALAWIFPLTLVAEFGFGTLITRDVAQYEQTAHQYLHTTSQLRLVIGGILVLLIWSAAPLLSRETAVVQGLQISAPLILILPFYGAFTAVFRAQQRMKPIVILNIGMLVTQVGLTTLVFVSGGGVLLALIVNTLTSAGQLVAAWFVYRRWFYRPAKVARLALRDLLKRATPFAVAAVLAALQARVSIILLEQLTNTGEVGYYAAASRFVEAGRMIPNALFGALLPALAAIAIRPEAMKQLFRRVMWGLSAFGIVFGIIFSFISVTILNLTYGESFAPAIIILQVLAWSLLPALLRSGRTLYWYALEREQFVNRVAAVALLVQIGLSLWLIPQFGAAGIAMVMIVVESVAFILLWRPISGYGADKQQRTARRNLS